MRRPLQLSGIRAIAAVAALAASMALPLRTVRAQVMTNFPPLGELPPIHLQIERTNDQRLKLQWSSVPWASYLIQCKSNLADSQWKVGGHWMEADSEISSMETEVPTGSSCFYRAVASGLVEALWARYYTFLLSYDAGDYYWVARRDTNGNILDYDEEAHARRIFRLVHLRFNSDVGTNYVTTSGRTLHRVLIHAAPAMELWRIMEEPVTVGRDVVAWGRVATTETVLADLRGDDLVDFAFPAYTGERGAIRLWRTGS